LDQLNGSQKQPVVALSSTESEYIGLGTAAKHTKYLRNLLESIGFEQTNATSIEGTKDIPDGLKDDATVLMGDNQGSLFLGNHAKTNSRTKHIDIRHHFIRECCESNIIKLLYIPTTKMLADLFTKPLGPNKFVEARKQFMSLLTREGVEN
jgi:hypothetical protein